MKEPMESLGIAIRTLTVLVGILAFVVFLIAGRRIYYSNHIKHDDVRWAIIQHGALKQLGDTPTKDSWGWKHYRCDHKQYRVVRVPCSDGCAMIDGVDICTHCGAIFPYGKGKQ